MSIPNQDFTPRQYMVTPDFEFFHYKDETTMEIEYHNHDFYEIYFLISGKVTYILEGKSYKLKPGDFLLINNRELHKPVIESGVPYERIVIWVNPEFIVKQSIYDCNLLTCFQTPYPTEYKLLRLKSEMLGTLRGILSKFQRACSGQGFGNSVLKNMYLIELLVYLNRAFIDTEWDEAQLDIECNEKIDKIIRHINENLNSDLTLDYLAAKFYMSKYHLLREFKKNAGYSIHQYIQKKRLILAKGLLKEGMQVTEVCEQCGFKDYSNFIRYFKKTYGVSPKKYFKIRQTGEGIS